MFFQTCSWFELGLLLLDDPGEDIVLQTYTQVITFPISYFLALCIACHSTECKDGILYFLYVCGYKYRLGKRDF